MLPTAPKRLSAALPAMLLALSFLLLNGCQRMQGSEQLMSKARHYQQQGQLKAAIIELKNVLQRESGNAAARVLLAGIYLDAGDALSAEKEWRRAAALGLPSAAVLPGLGKALLMQGRFEQVLKEIDASPPQPVLLALRGAAQLGLQQPEAAAALFAQALSLQPGLAPALLGQARLALARREPDAALALAGQALASQPDDVDALRLQGDLLRLQGKAEASRQSYQRIIILRPEDPQAHVDLANLFLQDDRIADAKAELAAARKTAPNSMLLIYTQAVVDFREGRLKTALEQLQLVLRTVPDHMPSILLSGAVYLGMDNLPQAGQALRTFLKVNPGHPYASKLMAALGLRTNQPDQAIAIVTPLLEQYPDDLELLALAGEAHLRQRQFDRAAVYFERASALAPQAAMLQAALGMSHIGLGENARAIAELEKASKLDIKSGQAGVLLVVTHLRSRQYDKALNAVNAMLQQQPDQALVHNLKGGVLLASKDMAGARASFEQALKLQPVYLPALQNLAQLDLLEKKPEQARQRFEAALAREKNSPAIMAELAKLATTRGRTDEATSWLERAVHDNPEALAPALMLSNYYTRAGDYQKALLLARKLHASNPDNADVLALLADAQASGGQQDVALESYRKLAVLQPQSANVQLRIATIQMIQKDQAGAAQTLHKALALQADFPQAQLAQVQLLTDQGAYGQALAVAREIQKNHPGAGMGFLLEGDILMRQKQLPAALQLYQRAFDTEPSGPMIIPIHTALKATGRRSDAYARLQQWLKDHPSDQPTRLHLASSLLADQDYRAAIAELEQIIRNDPDNIIALNDLAWSYQQVQDRRALGLAERAQRLAPANPAVLDTLGWILTGLGDTGRALPLLRKASELAPQAAEIRYHLGASLAKTGDKRAARTQLEQALASKDYPHRDEVKALLSQL